MPQIPKITRKIKAAKGEAEFGPSAECIRLAVVLLSQDDLLCGGTNVIAYRANRAPDPASGSSSPQLDHHPDGRRSHDWIVGRAASGLSWRLSASMGSGGICEPGAGLSLGGADGSDVGAPALNLRRQAPHS